MNTHPVDTASKGFSLSLRTHGIKIMPWLPADAETDDLTYELYGITDEERKIIEAAL
jgi:hypothetical protein